MEREILSDWIGFASFTNWMLEIAFDAAVDKRLIFANTMDEIRYSTRRTGFCSLSIVRAACASVFDSTVRFLSTHFVWSNFASLAFTHYSMHSLMRSVHRHKQHPWHYRQSQTRSRLTNFAPFWVWWWLLCASIDITKELNAIYVSLFFSVISILSKENVAFISCRHAFESIANIHTSRRITLNSVRWAHDVLKTRPFVIIDIIASMITDTNGDCLAFTMPGCGICFDGHRVCRHLSERFVMSIQIHVHRLQTIVQKLVFSSLFQWYSKRVWIWRASGNNIHKALCLLRYYVGVKFNTRRVSRQTDVCWMLGTRYSSTIHITNRKAACWQHKERPQNILE